MINDLSEWKVVDLHRKGADKNTWYFGVVKPDGKRLYASNRYGDDGVIFRSKAPAPVTIMSSVHGAGRYNGVNATNLLSVKSLSQAGAVRKIMRYLDALATDWNTRKAIEEAGLKEITFDKRKADIIPAERQLEAAPAEKKEEAPKTGRETLQERYERLRREGAR